MGPVAVGERQGRPVIVSGDDHGVRVWDLKSGEQVLGPLTGLPLRAVAVGALPDGTPVIVNGGGWGSDDGTVQVSLLADGMPVGDPLTGHTGGVSAVAVGALPDGSPVIATGGKDGTVRVWRLADGTPLVPPLRLSAPVGCIAAHGNMIVTAAGSDIAVHQPVPL